MKKSVKKIEDARYRQLHLRELKILRGYLARLPYECRGVYFKFIDIKRSTNELQNGLNRYMGSQNDMPGMNFRYAEWNLN